MFKLVQLTKLDLCYRCGLPIETPEELSIEHKQEWWNKPNAKELFHNLDNISFSHLKCNTRASRKPTKILSLDDPKLKHGGTKAYDVHGCRCDKCRAWKSAKNKKRN